MGALAVSVVYVGGRLATWNAGSRHGPFVGAAVIVIAARLASGPLAAALVAVLLGTGAIARVRPADIRNAIAVVGATIAVVARADMEIMLTFWLLGLLMNIGWRAAQATLARMRRVAADRKGRAPSAASEVTVIWS